MKKKDEMLYGLISIFCSQNNHFHLRFGAKMYIFISVFLHKDGSVVTEQIIVTVTLCPVFIVEFDVKQHDLLLLFCFF